MHSDWIGKIGIQLILQDPFYGLLFRQLPRIMEDNSPEISLVSNSVGNLSLQFPSYLEAQWKNPALIPLIQHELLHFLLDHPRQREMDNKKKEYFDLASDICVENFIHSPAPELLELQRINYLNWPASQSASYYYQLITRVMEGDSTAEKHKLEDLLAKRSLEFNKHDLWEANTGKPGNIHALLRKELNSNSNVEWPEGLYTLLNQDNTISQPINWKDHLYWLVRSSIKTKLQYRKNRYSRRYGQPPGLRIKRQHRLLLALDTSGSVREEEINLFFREINRLHKNKLEIEIVECDAAIQQRYLFSGNFPTMVKGRGSTNYNPPIELLNEDSYFGGLIYFTDGLGPEPFIVPKRPLLWVIRGENPEILDKLATWPGRVTTMK